MRLPPFRLALALLLALLLPPAARAAELGEPSIGDPAAPVTIIEARSAFWSSGKSRSTKRALPVSM